MTNQNKIHKYIRECEQLRKTFIRHNQIVNGSYQHHTHKWWDAWNKRQKSEQLKEQRNE